MNCRLSMDASSRPSRASTILEHGKQTHVHCRDTRYGSVSELQPLGNLESPHEGRASNLIHELPIALLRERCLHLRRIRISILWRIAALPIDPPPKLRLEVLVYAPSNVIKELGDRAAVIVQDACVESFVEISQRH